MKRRKIIIIIVVVVIAVTGQGEGGGMWNERGGEGERDSSSSYRN